MRRTYTIVLFVVMASIDNTVLALLPALAPSIRADLLLSDRATGLVVGLNLLIVALSALFWGYYGDQHDRRRLLILGTLAWVAPLGAMAWVSSFAGLLLVMAVAGVGLGCIATVGYSIITDLIPPRWRGLMLGVWGLAQGIGGLVGLVLAGSDLRSVALGWRSPFLLVACAGVICTLLALFALSPRKGAAEGASVNVPSESYRIARSDVPHVFRRPTMRWLMLQGLLAQFTFGSFVWLPTLLTARLVPQGLRVEQANGVAALLVALLQVGGVVSLYWGWLGDRLQRRYPSARALLAAFGFWTAAPLFILLFWVPLPLTGAFSGAPASIIAGQLAHNAWWWVALGAAILAVAAQATNAPNWYALVAEVNLPEHRGTAFSFVALANNVGRAIGVVCVGVVFDWLRSNLTAPTNYALGLTLFQLFVIPAGVCFWLAARTSPVDSAAVRTIVAERDGGVPQ